jgi:hypothetical protein
LLVKAHGWATALGLKFGGHLPFSASWGRTTSSGGRATCAPTAPETAPGARPLSCVGQGQRGRPWDAVTGRRDAGWSWAKGAAGEAAVASTLAALPATHWRVLHDLPIGRRGANVDHLLIGPPGVFCVNTKHLSGRVDVNRDEIRRNGRRTRFLAAATIEAQRVQAILEHHMGEPVSVEPLLVVHGAKVRVASQPRDVTVLTSAEVAGWLCALPAVLAFQGWQLCCRVATSPSTWEAAEPQRADRVITAGGVMHVTRWQRYGHDRLYVRSVTGEEYGWLNLRTGEVNVQTASNADRVRGAATAWLRG